MNSPLTDLFRQNEGIAFGSVKDNFVGTLTELTKSKPEFYSINPIDLKLDHGSTEVGDFNRPRRADINVTAFRNFLFEMDSVPLETQVKIWSILPQPTLLTFSGSKSYHGIYSLTTDLPFEPHKKESIEKYKGYWTALAKKLDETAVAAGFELPPGKSSFFDPACKNPSRLSRTPGSKRATGEDQTLLSTGPLFITEDLPPIKYRNHITAEVPQNGPKSVLHFERTAPAGLMNMLVLSNIWAASEGLYPTILRLALWAIDSTGVPQNVLTAVFEKHVVPNLKKAGYPIDKIYKPIKNAYEMKGIE